jgi:hypothetical protein
MANSSAYEDVSAEALKFAHCMRAHGVTSYADPAGPGNRLPASTSVGMTYLGDSFDPDTPTFQAAEHACQKDAIGLATRVAPGAAGQVQREALGYATCMRAHGVPSFPDPSPAGGFSLPGSINASLSFFRVAEQACKKLLPRPPGLP